MKSIKKFWRWATAHPGLLPPPDKANVRITFHMRDNTPLELTAHGDGFARWVSFDMGGQDVTIFFENEDQFQRLCERLELPINGTGFRRSPESRVI